MRRDYLLSDRVAHINVGVASRRFYAKKNR